MVVLREQLSFQVQTRAGCRPPTPPVPPPPPAGLPLDVPPPQPAPLVVNITDDDDEELVGTANVVGDPEEDDPEEDPDEELFEQWSPIAPAL